MDSGFETSNDSTEGTVDITKLLQIEFRNLIEKNNRKDFNFAEQSTSYSGSAPHSWKIKSRLHHDRSRHSNDYDGILNTSKEKRLSFAAMTNNVELVTQLLQLRNINPNASDNYKRTALHLAASRGYANVVKVLIEYGANPNVKDSLGNTPLHLAACTWNKPVIKALINGGANIQILDSNKQTPYRIVLSKLNIRAQFESKQYGDDYRELARILDPNPNHIKSEEDMKRLLENLNIN